MIKLAIVGRPNVGKSALFNRICKKRISIVDEAEGITRDRIYAEGELFGQPFQIIDTGGIDPLSKEPFNALIRRQAAIAIEEADSILFVVDAKVGVTLLDEQVAQILRSSGKSVTLAVNKVDDRNQKELFHEFYSLGFAKMVAVSAVHGLHIAELLEMALQGVECSEELPRGKGIHIAIVGRPNVGKSTLINYLLQEERCIVSPEAGTTRDSIDVELQIDGSWFTLIDTAGMRRKKAEKASVDKFAAIRTERAIERADICFLMLSAEEGITSQEKRIARQIEEKGKGCILLFNKWDLVKGFRMEHCLEAIRKEALFLQYCPTLFTAAKEGRNLDKLFPIAKQVFESLNHRITTGQLNKFLEETIQKVHPPMLKGKRLRIYYAAQVATNPPHFVFFVNKPELMLDSYKKYLINAFRKTYPFEGVPLLFSLKGKIDRHKEEFTPAEDSTYRACPLPISCDMPKDPHSL